MGRVTGIGGVFFKVSDPAATRAWYERHLGLRCDEYGTSFEWGEDKGRGFTLWSPFTADTDYFEAPFMINFRVEDLDGLMEQLKNDGIEPVSALQVHEYGRFVQIIDCDGNRVELWEPKDDAYDEMIGDARTS